MFKVAPWVPAKHGAIRGDSALQPPLGLPALLPGVELPALQLGPLRARRVLRLHTPGWDQTALSAASPEWKGPSRSFAGGVVVREAGL